MTVTISVPRSPTQVQQEVFMTQTRSPSFRPLLAAFIFDVVSLWFTCLLPAQDPHSYVKEANVYMLPPAVMLLFLVPALWRHRLVRTYVIDAANGFYEFYISTALVYRGQLRNVYVRLKGIGTAGGETYYCLIFNGYQMEELTITGYTTSLMKLRKLGRRLANRLNVNYFDVHDLSAHHVIMHRTDFDATSRELVSVGQTSSIGLRISPV